MGLAQKAASSRVIFFPSFPFFGFRMGWAAEWGVGWGAYTRPHLPEGHAPYLTPHLTTHTQHRKHYKVVKYFPGQYYNRHHDFWRANAAENSRMGK